MLEYMKNALESLREAVKRCVSRVHEALLRLPPLENLLLRPRNRPNPPEKVEVPPMPLVKSPSKAAFRKNISKEVKAGNPVKQAVAIAYSVKRRAAAKKGKKGK